MSNETTLTAEPGQPTIVVTRWFDAPADLVYEACTRPELVKQWWGPCNFTVVVCEIDLRVGGAWRNVLRAPDGHEEGFHGVYREIVPRERIVQTFVYEPFPQAEAIESATLVEHEGRTRLTVTITHQSVENRDAHLQSGMEHGMRDTHERLEALLGTLRQAA